MVPFLQDFFSPLNFNLRRVERSISLLTLSRWANRSSVNLSRAGNETPVWISLMPTRRGNSPTKLLSSSFHYHDLTRREMHWSCGVAPPVRLRQSRVPLCRHFIHQQFKLIKSAGRRGCGKLPVFAFNFHQFPPIRGIHLMEGDTSPDRRIQWCNHSRPSLEITSWHVSNRNMKNQIHR